MPPPSEVEFEHRRLKPGAVPPSLQRAQTQLGSLQSRMLQRAQLWRALFVVTGAFGLAFFTQRAGIELPYAICLFFGALPVLWVGGWLFGFLVHAKGAVKDVASTVGSVQWQKELQAAAIVERVKLAMSPIGLHVTRDQQLQVLNWRRVRIERMNPQTLVVYVNDDPQLALSDRIAVPKSAFANAADFDAFCLEMQRYLWEAERK